jgi:hypothetical protein
VELSTVIKIHKHKGFHEWHHFTLMVVEIHNVFECDMDHFIKECAQLFHNKRSKVHLSLFFCIEIFKQHVSIVRQHVLTSIIKKKVVLARDICFKPPVTIRFQQFACKQN